MEQIAAIIEEHGYVIVFVLLLVHETGVPSPIPSDLFVIYAATYRQELSIEPVPLIAIATLATFIPSTLLYALGRYRGAALVDRHCERFGIGRDRIRSARLWTGRNGAWAFFLARIVPGGRTLSPLAAGCLDLPWRVFLPVNAAAITVRWAIAYTLGAVLGERAVQFMRASGLPWWMWLSAIVIVGFAVALHRSGLFAAMRSRRAS